MLTEAATTLPAAASKTLDRFIDAVHNGLGANLYSLLLYGSAVRGGFSAKSDLNVMLVLEVSTPEAHRAVANAMPRRAAHVIDPFVLARVGIERSVLAFPVKFHSIQRHHQLLRGEDFISAMTVDVAMARHHAEQALRNMRLRCVHAYIQSQQERSIYAYWLRDLVPALMTDLGELARLDDVPISDDFYQRVPELAQHFGLDPASLAEVVTSAPKIKRLSVREIDAWHRIVFGLLDTAVTAVAESQ